MSEQRVVLKIMPGGEIESTVEGIAGPSCEDKTKWLDALGTVTTHKHTPDYFAHVSTETTSEQATVGTGSSSEEGGGHGSPW